MAEASDRLGIIFQNLKDAGCDDRTIECCMSYVANGNLEGMLPVLIDQRSSLLATIHTGQKQIDCLDYLIYKIQKRKI